MTSIDKTISIIPKVDYGSELDQHLEIFQSFKPPKFNGACDPLDVEDWLLKIEKIFDEMICPEDRKVALTTFMMEGEAKRWWQTQHIEKFYLTPLSQIAWDDFVQVFRDWFIPPSARLTLQKKFFNLKQGSNNVMQYEAEFTLLSRHALQYISTQEEKCHRFLKGLRHHLRLTLEHFNINEFSVLVERARKIENELNYSNQQFGSLLKEKKCLNRRYEQYGKRPRADAQQYQLKQIQVDRPVCVSCDRRHFGQCLKGSGKCYRCGQAGHRAHECPKNRKTNVQQGYYQNQRFQKRYEKDRKFRGHKFMGKSSTEERGRSSGCQAIYPTNAIVYAMTSREAENSNEVLAGDSYDSVPLWERKFCSQIPWAKFCDGKEYIFAYDNVLEWDDSAGKECFDNAKARFWAKINGLHCDIPSPDPDMYIDVVDQDAILDPELVEDLYKQPPPPPPREDPDNSTGIKVMGWDVEVPRVVYEPKVPEFIFAGGDQSPEDPSQCSHSENPILAANEPVTIAPTGWGDEEDVGSDKRLKSPKMHSRSREMDGKDWNFGRMNCDSWVVRKERSWEHNGYWNNTKHGNCGVGTGVEQRFSSPRRFSSRAANVRDKGEYIRRDDDSRCFYWRRKNHKDEGYYLHDWAPPNDHR